MTFIAKYWSQILLAAVLLFLFFALKDCKGRKDQYAAIQQAHNELQAKVRQDSINNARAHEQYEAKARDAKGLRQLAEREKTDADNKVATQQRTIDRLTAVIRNSSNNSNSSDLVQVTPTYKSACDSLPTKIDKLNAALVEKDSAINEWSDILGYEIQIRDEEIYRQMNYTDSLRADFNRQTALLKSAISQGKPRGRLLGGIGIMGNEQKILAGANIKLAYQTKTGKQYQISAHGLQLPGMNSVQVVYEGAVLFSILK